MCFCDTNSRGPVLNLICHLIALSLFTFDMTWAILLGEMHHRHNVLFGARTYKELFVIVDS